MYIRNDDPIHYRRAGHCTRCEIALDDTAYIVRDRVFWRVIGSGENSLGLWQLEWVPVCEPCAGPSAVDKAGRSYVCGGCGMEMKGPEAWKSRVCSERCEQRVRRSRKKAMELRACTSCGKSFKGRADARFCSPPCRQQAYRQRSKVFDS